MPELPMADRHETVLPQAPEEARQALANALAADLDTRLLAVSAVVADHPTFLEGWAQLAALGREPIERYAYARVGYHRGLDALRAAGWGGRGFVRWSESTNRSFLSCLVRLRAAAAEIGEQPEVERIGGFLHELDPDWDDANLVA
ncbi:DUF3151 family protein [Egicoccus halophilus]|uniref:DUF3151 domain-containing protein n=1 Tax=Egicoccus halophilus TaxID=1670830 RepID=A0A8J3AD01_9ACTN|nr:DUF3151 family protein [Egicoccus halophilus]GGI09110.1 hypothetical protein GCM10011354_32450 [Egicoccus halophilus]